MRGPKSKAKYVRKSEEELAQSDVTHWSFGRQRFSSALAQV